WNMEDVLNEELKVIKATVGPDDHVICALSGGVDSTVAATLVHKAIGDRLKFVSSICSEKKCLNSHLHISDPVLEFLKLNIHPFPLNNQKDRSRLPPWLLL
ncbi:hypothetical protein Dimus_028455, partial [Dionaea muscipula]